MKIKLKGKLPQAMKDMNLYAGQIIRDAEPAPMTLDGTLRFLVQVEGEFQRVTVSKENYTLL